MELRPYQQAAREAVENRWEQGDDSTLLSIPTGCGKTVIFAKIAEDSVIEVDGRDTDTIIEEILKELAACRIIGKVENK